MLGMTKLLPRTECDQFQKHQFYWCGGVSDRNFGEVWQSIAKSCGDRRTDDNEEEVNSPDCRKAKNQRQQASQSMWVMGGWGDRPH